MNLQHGCGALPVSKPPHNCYFIEFVLALVEKEWVLLTRWSLEVPEVK